MATGSRDDLREVVRRVILEYATHKPSDGDIDTEAVMDEKRGHYQVVQLGWDEEGDGRVFGCMIHIDVKDDKIWIQNDNTASGVADDLLEAGIPPESIVLGFHPEYIRQHTGFAVC